MRRVLCILALSLAVFHSGTAQADDDKGYTKSNWPLSLVKRPVVPIAGMVELRGDTLRANLSKGSAFEPVSLAPDVFVGLAKGWTVGITHDTGICLTGETGGCPSSYDDTGLEVNYSLMGKGSFLLAATGGARVSSYSDPFVMGLEFGFLSRMSFGKVAVDARPRLYVGLAERDLRGDLLDLPIDIHYQVHTQTAVSLETGFLASLDDIGGANRIPVGLATLVAVNERIDFGAALRFTNLAGSDGGIDGREIIGRFALRL